MCIVFPINIERKRIYNINKTPCPELSDLHQNENKICGCFVE